MRLHLAHYSKMTLENVAVYSRAASTAAEDTLAWSRNVSSAGRGNFMARTSQQYAKEGYAENVITYACIQRDA
jgi:hypothetical protein